MAMQFSISCEDPVCALCIILATFRENGSGHVLYTIFIFSAMPVRLKGIWVMSYACLLSATFRSFGLGRSGAIVHAAGFFVVLSERLI